MTNMSTIEIIDRGLDCLLENLGTIETERFVSTIIREQFDYTRWRRRYFEDISIEEFGTAASAYEQAHPFKPEKQLSPVE